MSKENPSQVGDELSAIADVEDLVKQGRVPIRLQSAEIGSHVMFAGKKHIPEGTNAVFYNIPPVGFTLGQNGCTGKIDPVACSVEYFDGDGESLGQGELVAVRVSEATEMDKEIDTARERFSF